MAKWWQEAVIYQIYIRSFYDSNNDGIGDIKGVISKLDYLKNLGVTAIWISPFYASPMDDNGYDVSDFHKVAPDYGTIEDIKLLITELKKRGMKLIIDLILNHTSDEHFWFKESRKSVNNPYRDYYIWQEAKEDGSLPSNWESFFGGSVWEFDEQTKSYYMHIFSKKMPDLNWRNPILRKEMHKMINWWLDLGVDGFRVDAVAHLEKNWDFPNHEVPKGRKYSPCYYEYSNLDKVHDYIQEIYNEVWKDKDILLIGEAGGVSIEDSLKYCSYSRNEFNMLINFDHCWCDEAPESAPYVPSKWTYKKLDLVSLKKSFKKYQVAYYGKAWNTLYWSNHDQPRVISHYGNDNPQYHNLSGKMLATCLYMMGGTPIIYQGEEIGMTNVNFESLDDYRDIEVFTLYNETVNKNIASKEDIMDRIHKRSRDNARTPMQWNETQNAGFSKVEPWIKVNSNYKTINVAANLKDKNSLFYYYQKLFAIRQKSNALIYGDFKLYLEDDKNIVLYTRTYKTDKYLIIVNFFDNEVEVNIPSDLKFNKAKWVIGNYSKRELNLKMIMRPYEAIVYYLT